MLTRLFRFIEALVPGWPALAKRGSTVEQRLSTLEKASAAHSHEIRSLVKDCAAYSRYIQVRTFADWIERVDIPASKLVSVILPTRNRCNLLARAVASITNQTYSNFEVIIIDDGSTDGTPELLKQIQREDPRLRVCRLEGCGVCAARNAGLSLAEGEIVAYLDDDNLMHMNWVKSIVWAFTRYPETSLLYGAHIIDDPLRIQSHQSGGLPLMSFPPFDRDALAHNNLADMGTIAHRAGLPDAHFDESLSEFGDWDLFLRLTRDAPPLVLPAIAAFYMTDAPNRLSHESTYVAEHARVRQKHRS